MSTGSVISWLSTLNMELILDAFLTWLGETNYDLMSVSMLVLFRILPNQIYADVAHSQKFLVNNGNDFICVYTHNRDASFYLTFDCEEIN